MPFEEHTGKENQWWWKRLWKIQIPLMTIITNKLLTWEMLSKRGFEGPGLFSLCRSSDETISHLFSSCPYAGNVWMGIVGMLSARRTHERESATLEVQTKTWWHDEGVGPYEAFHVLFVYSIWKAHDRSIFNNTWNPPHISITLLMNKIEEHKLSTIIPKKGIIRGLVINN